PVVLVTGSAQRIGRAIARELAQHGFDVAVHYRASRAQALGAVAELRAAGATAHAFEADLADEAACRALVPRVVARFGRLDALVNNASMFEHDDAASFGYAAMERHWRANTGPAVLLAQALHTQWLAPRALPRRPARRALHLQQAVVSKAEAEAVNSAEPGASGCVVNLLDQKLWNPNPDYFSYTLSKAALQAATVMLAQAFAPHLRVCGVAPGVTLLSGPMNAAEFAAAHRLTPLERSSTPQDIARAVRFLIESPAITGTTLLVDGGQHLSAQPRDVLYLARETAPPSPPPAPKAAKRPLRGPGSGGKSASPLSKATKTPLRSVRTSKK
ncbi:MAG: SDR family oxidoreductase, partial [Burkholderiaceae bacterium]